MSFDIEKAKTKGTSLVKKVWSKASEPENVPGSFCAVAAFFLVPGGLIATPLAIVGGFVAGKWAAKEIRNRQK